MMTLSRMKDQCVVSLRGCSEMTFCSIQGHILCAYRCTSRAHYLLCVVVIGIGLHEGIDDGILEALAELLIAKCAHKEYFMQWHQLSLVTGGQNVGISTC